MVRIRHKKKEDETCLRTGDKASVLFRFMTRPEVIHAGTTIIFREGTTRGVARIRRVFNDSFKDPMKAKDIDKEWDRIKAEKEKKKSEKKMSAPEKEKTKR